MEEKWMINIFTVITWLVTKESLGVDVDVIWFKALNGYYGILVLQHGQNVGLKDAF